MDQLAEAHLKRAMDSLKPMRNGKLAANFAYGYLLALLQLSNLDGATKGDGNGGLINQIKLQAYGWLKIMLKRYIDTFNC